MSYLFGIRAEVMSAYVEYIDEVIEPQAPVVSTVKHPPSRFRAIMDLTDDFDFGKHAGKALAVVIVDFPDYVKWLVKNDVVPFTEEVIDRIERLQ